EIAPAGGEVVVADGDVAGLRRAQAEMAADIAGAAGDEDGAAHRRRGGQGMQTSPSGLRRVYRTGRRRRNGLFLPSRSGTGPPAAPFPSSAGGAYTVANPPPPRRARCTMSGSRRMRS